MEFKLKYILLGNLGEVLLNHAGSGIFQLLITRQDGSFISSHYRDSMFMPCSALRAFEKKLHKYIAFLGKS